MLSELDTYIGSNASVAAGGTITLRSEHNTETQTGGQAHATSTMSGGGILGLNDTSADSTADAEAMTHVDSGARLTAGGAITVAAFVDNTAHSFTDGTTGGVIVGGDLDADSTASGEARSTLSSLLSLSAASLTVFARNVTSATGDTDSPGTFGVVAIGNVTTSADAAPTVEATISGGGSINPATSLPYGLHTSGAITVTAVARGNATSDSDAIGGGAIEVGIADATAKWRPTVTASVGSSSVVSSSGGNIKIQALNNYDDTGETKDTGNRPRATSEATGGGAIDVRSADAETIVDSSVSASIGNNASVTASGGSNDVTVRARSRNNAEVVGDGYGGGIASWGSIDGSASMESETHAFTGTGARISAGDDVTVLSQSDNAADVDVNGGNGGLFAHGGADAEAELSNPVIEAKIGNNSTITAGGKVEISAENTINLSANSDQTVGGAIVDNNTNATTNVINSRTTADIGTGVTISSDEFVLAAKEVSVYVEAITDANVPFDLAGNNVAHSTINADFHTLAHVGGGNTDITGNSSAQFLAKALSVRTKATAHTATIGLTGNLHSIADNDKTVDVQVCTDAPSHIQTQALLVEATAPDETDSTDFIRDAPTDANTVVHYVTVIIGYACSVIVDILCLGIFCDGEEVCDPITELVEEILGADVDSETPGTETITTGICFNSDVLIGAPIDAQMIVDSAGVVQQLDHVTINDGANPVLEGQTVTTGTIVVEDIVNNSPGTVHLNAPTGYVTRFSEMRFLNAFQEVLLRNDSAKDMFINDIDVVNKSEPPITISSAQGQNTFDYTLSTNATETVIDISNNNVADKDITLLGFIDNPLGETRIHNEGGDIFATPPNALIQTRLLDLTADNGRIGASAAARIPIKFVFEDGTLEPGLTNGIGDEGVYLDITSVTDNNTLLLLHVDELGATHGAIDILSHGGFSVEPATLKTIHLTDGSSVQGIQLDDIFDPSVAVNSTENTINLGFDHGFSGGEEVTYNNGGGSSIGGLRNGNFYRIRVIDDNVVQLANSFNAATAVDAFPDTISFGFNHGYQTGDRVVYDNDGNGSIGGLVNGATYFVRYITNSTIKLAASLADATASASIFDPDTALDAATDQITFAAAHNFATGEAVTYHASGSPVGGLAGGRHLLRDCDGRHNGEASNIEGKCAGGGCH